MNYNQAGQIRILASRLQAAYSIRGTRRVRAKHLKRYLLSPNHEHHKDLLLARSANNNLLLKTSIKIRTLKQQIKSMF